MESGDNTSKEAERLIRIGALLKKKVQKIRNEDSISKLYSDRELYHELMDFLSTAKNNYKEHADYFEKKLERMDFPGLKKTEALAVIEYASNLFETEPLEKYKPQSTVISAIKIIGIVIVLIVVASIVGAYFLDNGNLFSGFTGVSNTNSPTGSSTTISGQSVIESIPVSQNSTMYITAQSPIITLNLGFKTYLHLYVSSQSGIITLNGGYVYLSDSGQSNTINIQNTTLLSNSDTGQGNTINNSAPRGSSSAGSGGSATNSTSGSTSSGNSGGSCPSSVQMGSYATESTGGTCTGYVVQMGDYSTYTNYQNACPSSIQGGSYDTYYNNVSGCNPTIQLGYGSKSCYLGSCS